MGFKVADGPDMNAAFWGICGKELWFEVHQQNLFVPSLVDNYLGFEVFGQVEKYLLFSQVVGKQETPIIHVGAHNVDKPLISFLSRGKVIFWISKCVVQVQVINIDSDPVKARVPSLDGA